MSEIRLVRCPKCNKVLPEPQVCTVYQCGGCGAMLKAKNRSSESGNLVNSDTFVDKGIEGEEGIKDSGELSKEDIVHEGGFDMDSRSPARSAFVVVNRRKLLVDEKDFAEFYGDLPKSPMRDRFLNDLGSTPQGSRNVSPSPTRGTGLGDGNSDGVGTSPARSRDVSMSPMRERGSKSPMSVRTRYVSMSPLRGANAARRSPVRSMDGDISNKEGFISNFDERRVKEEEGEGVRKEKMTPKTSFNTWLPEDNSSKPSNDDSLGRRRKQWRDRVTGDEADRISEGKESVYADEHGMTSEGSIIDDPIHGGESSRERSDRDLRFRDDYAGGYGRSRANADQRFAGSDGDGLFHRNLRVSIESGRKSASSSALDASANYHLDSIHSFGRSRHSFEIRRGPANMHYMEHREFLPKYQGSMKQYPSKELSHSDDNLFSSSGFYTGADDHTDDLRYRRGSRQRYSPENYMPRRPYLDHRPGLDYEMKNTSSPSPLYDDPYASHVRSAYRSRKQQFSQHGMPGYVAGQSLDYDRDSFMSYRIGMHSHHPADMQGHDLPSFAYRMAPIPTSHPTSSRSMNLERPDPRAYDPRVAQTNPRERSSHLAPRHTRRVQLANQNNRVCLPIVGGSPFVICHKCFELLKLPGNFMTKHKKEYQLQCGACSSIMSFDLQDKSFGVVSSRKKTDTVKSTGGSGESFNEPGPRHTRRESYAATSTGIGSYDFDAPGNSFQTTESEVIEASRRQKLSSNVDDNARAISPSSCSSKEERVSRRSSCPNSSELPLMNRPPPGSPLREHLDYSNHFIIAGVENERSYAGKEKQVLETDNSQDSSVVNPAIASETEFHSHELSDSGDVSGEYKDRSKDRRSSSPPSWKALASKSGRSSPGKSEVYVNGQHIPIHLVRKAEKLAGLIQPGEYWYDYVAGFWGVMGHHCLGILPPAIQEFSFPMLENCSKGDTAVYVNGRELRKKDLDLLASRQLPITRDKRYIIDKSGKVLEEQSKNFVVNLGKLAPTVEKRRQGFGMRVPEEFME
ncbi:uncharacterized protein LOC130801589 isoform X1 [Amaranthus tricolor]|uniref:uncharacterized protein LOC130801589 isoform X1 n=2 Tax=Amaranthus tricolor TaxID=29722 RepID=UPI00258F80A4|nr:uncharacterized protein LOC130801589 isoform X1 [Amaranthus tricolor]